MAAEVGWRQYMIGSSPLVRRIWRAAPVGLRRRFAHGVLGALAPRLPPLQETPVDAPAIIVGFLSSASGLGQAARLAYLALERQGCPVLGVDLSRHFFETSDVVSFSFRDGAAHRGPGRVLININAPYLKYVFHLLGADFLARKHVTGYWAWELPSVPGTWRDGLARVHDIAVPSSFVADALGKLGETPPVRVLPHPVVFDPPPNLPTGRDDGRFDVVSVFNAASGFERKNPLAAIAAFKIAAQGDSQWRLRLLISNAEHYEPGRAALVAAAREDPRIELTFSALDRDAYWRWYGAPDLYISLHRSEGFGLTLAEAMLAGVPVLATHWSGNADFMSQDNSLPVRYRLVPVVDPQSKYESGAEVWADADVDHAAELMRYTFLNRAWSRQLSARARVQALERWACFQF